MSTTGMAHGVVRYRPLGESVQEFVVLSPRASKGKPEPKPQTMGRLNPTREHPSHLLSLQEALVLLRERWQMEMLYKL